MPAKRITAVAAGAVLVGAFTVTAPAEAVGLEHAAAATKACPSAGKAPKLNWGKPTFVDDFTGSGPNKNNWFIYHYPKDRIPRVREAIQVRNGALEIASGLRGGRETYGGLIHKQRIKYGRWEVRVRADRGAGFRPVVLLWPPEPIAKWPDDGEINLIEMHDGARKKALHFLHFGPNDDKCDWLVRKNFTRWHTVAVDWLPNRITFWVDGKQTVSITDRKYIPTTSVMQLALQNDPECCRNGATPKLVRMYVDWVKVYRRP
ncbi:glycoside hydrolase family 16 protein [Herbidospora sp. NBRC 101105]|uniref:glycoside hydrolase family 16 protein n=1 Tax=Herbidospora sp. NBRC 101105 TaxID=3032195 RepID=UPI0024A1C11C|nr:glycoside hydrolase family 16 protein [Herbidospora sp. NBRC 101105]GLX93083.1 hypothetical protein Hesp01_10330 [Herbidospora sp. NBRC 101105]